ncbi:MAG: tripartite tricarboxylate transporter substrate binding protein [Microcystis sp. LE19-4.1E]|jgi:tripartite-type tricarboxylate transporter receptor subunit TctC|nr:tripartite tricarboxylate transporter substrate binding protein [Microcystis sp. LE19-4.1E]
MTEDLTTFTKVSRRGLVACLLALGVGTPGVAWAQEFPARPIKLLVGFAPGGGTDSLARIIAAGLSEIGGQQVVVENRTGAGGNLATAAAAKADADGYTLLFASASQIVVSPNTFATMPVDPVKDLAHIAMVGDGHFFGFVNAQLPVKTLQDFVDFAKKNPGKLKFGTSGAGNIVHTGIELFKLRAGIDMTAVHYRGTGPMMPEILSNQIQFGFDGAATFEAHTKPGGPLRVLFVAAKERSPFLPDVPTAAEAGVKGLEGVTNWYGVHAPKGTPPAVVERIRGLLAKVVQLPQVKEKMAVIGQMPVTMTPAEFLARIESDLKGYAEAAKAAAIRIE